MSIIVVGMNQTPDGDLNWVKQHLYKDIDEVTRLDAVNSALMSLKGAPKSVKGDFDISGTLVDSLKYFPESVGTLRCYRCTRLKSLLGVKRVKHGIFTSTTNVLAGTTSGCVSIEVMFKKSGTDVIRAIMNDDWTTLFRNKLALIKAGHKRFASL